MIQITIAALILFLMFASYETGQQNYPGIMMNECQKKYNVYRCEIKAVPITESEGERK